MAARSDTAIILEWWKGLGDETFVALAPPIRDRYTQSDGHDDHAELAEQVGGPVPDSFAFWHWQSHERAFPKRGQYVGPLLIHWGGDHATVRAGLGSGPDGFTIIDHGPHGAFELDKVTAHDPDGLPAPDDAVGSRKLLERLTAPVSRSVSRWTYPPLTEAETAWLQARIDAGGRLESLTGAVRALELRDAVSPEDARALGARWLSEHTGRLTVVEGWQPLLRAMLRTEDESAWAAASEIGADVYSVVASVPDPRAVDFLRGPTFAGDREAVGAWLTARVGESVTDPLPAILTAASELEQAGVPDSLWHEFSITAQRLQSQLLGDPSPAHQPAALRTLTNSLDERLPDRLRATYAARAEPAIAKLRAWADSQPADAVIRSDYSVADLHRDLARFAATPAPTVLVGPDLTTSESLLTPHWENYRQLDEAKTAWLRAQVADPRTEMQGLGFCLELLYAHGVASADDIDALAPQWRKKLAKKYETTYTEWRHPLVVLTCLAQELEHPLAAALLTWWQKPSRTWKTPLALMTVLGAPTEENIVPLLGHTASGQHDTGQVKQWALAQARLSGHAPQAVLDALINDGSLGIREHVLARDLIALADPAQPMWHYAVGNTMSWWHRITQTVDDDQLSDTARALALAAAGKHRLITHPDGMRPRQDEETVVAAREWYAERSGA